MQNQLTPDEGRNTLSRIAEQCETLKPLMDHANPRVIRGLQCVDNALMAMVWALEAIAKEKT